MVASALDLEAAIEDFRDRLQSGLNVECIVLYGSYARGNAYEDSDIDVVVVSRDFEGMPMSRRQEMIASLSRDADLRISPIGYPSSEYANPDPNSFLHEVIRTGRVVRG